MSTTTAPVTSANGPTHANDPFEESHQRLSSNPESAPKPDSPDQSHVRLSRVNPFNREAARRKKAAQAMSQVYDSLKDVSSHRHEPSNFHAAYIRFVEKRNELAKTYVSSQLGPEAVDYLTDCIQAVETNAFVYLCCKPHSQVDVELCNKYRQQYLDVGCERNGGVIPSWSDLTEKEIKEKTQIRRLTRIKTKMSNRETVILPTGEDSESVTELCTISDSLPGGSKYMMTRAVSDRPKAG